MAGRIPTIEDIAKHAGVSPTTVSFVLNDVPVKLQQKTRAKVLAAARELGYYPNSAARSLKTRQTHVFALINPSLKDPYFSEFAHLFWDAAMREGYRVSISYGDEVGETETARPEELHHLIAMRVDGILLHDVTYPHDPDAATVPELKRFPLPIVSAGRRTSTLPPHPAVQFDLAAGGGLAARHLLSLGRRKLLYVGVADARLAGVRQALDDAGVDLQIIHCTAADDPRLGIALDLFRAATPDGVIASNDILATRMMGMLQASGIRVPDDTAVLGMGNVALCAMLYPTLTSISLCRTEMVAIAISMLTALAQGATVPESYHLLQPKLVARASTIGTTSHDASADEAR